MKFYHTGLTDDLRQRLVPLIPKPKPGGLPCKVKMREVVTRLFTMPARAARGRCSRMTFRRGELSGVTSVRGETTILRNGKTISFASLVVRPTDAIKNPQRQSSTRSQ